MKILPLLMSLYESLLIEANLINGKDPFNGVSLAAFLEQFTAGLNTNEARLMFVKKLSRLLMADERFLYAVRELPPGAPAWAQQSMEAGDLVYFQPSPELKDNIENLSHYVAALEQDMAGGDANAKAVATREMQGFPKAETLDLLLAKVHEYFSRGGEKAEASETEGMKPVLEAAGGYVWYKLETPKAFYREGQTLSNCIGKHYTAENTQATNTTIYVLRDKSNNSVVATRIKDGEMQEVKGKGNTPPIPRYMPAVQKLINTFNITLASGGRSDVGNSGYFYSDGILYSKPQAIAKLVHTNKLFNIPGTKLYVGQVVSDSPELIATLYLNNSYYYSDSPPKIYQVGSDDSDPIVAIYVDDDAVKRIVRLHSQESSTDNATSPLTTMISMLAKNGVIKSIDSDVARELYFQDGAHWDKKTLEFSFRSDAKTGQVKPKQKGTHTLDVYEGEEAKELVRQVSSTSRDKLDPENVKAVYTAVVRKATEQKNKQTDKLLIVVEHKDGSTAIFSTRGAEIDPRQAGYTRQDIWNAEPLRDGKTVNTLVELANERGFKLPQRFQVSHGLSYREGQYIPLPELTPTEVPGDPSAAMFDLSNLDPMDKATVIARAISSNDTKPHMSPFTGDFKFRGITRGLDSVIAGKKDADHFYSSSADARDRDHSTVTAKDIGNWAEGVFGTSTPTAIYRVNIKYGADKGGKVSMVASGKTIAAIDTETLDHTWQSRDDYQRVSDQLNKFASNNGFKFDKQAVKKSPQLRVGKDGMLVPAEALAKSRMETRLGRDKSVAGRTGGVQFADGTTAKKMSQDDYGTWSAHGIKKNVAGTPWEIINDKGDVVSIVIVSRDNKISRIYSNPMGVPGPDRTTEVGGRELPIIATVDAMSMPYVKQLAAEFNWTDGEQSSVLKAGGVLGKMLRQMYKSDRRGTGRTYVPRAYKSAPGVPEEDRYVKGKAYYNIAGPLKQAGLVNISDAGDGARGDYIRLTNLGRKVAAKLADGDDVQWSTITGDPAELSGDYRRPEEQAPVERVAREPGAPRAAGAARTARAPMEGGGTKADLALQRFRELTVANNGTMPSRAEFIALMQQAPFNMTPAGASTYQYNSKVKYMREQGEINEHFTFIDFLTYIE